MAAEIDEELFGGYQVGKKVLDGTIADPVRSKEAVQSDPDLFEGYSVGGSEAVQPETTGRVERVGQVVSDVFTGNDRTEFEDLPEFDLPASMAVTNPIAMARTAFGLMATFDPKRQKTLLENNFPKLRFEQDKYGNTIVDASAYGGDRGYLNKPGGSFRDATQVAGQFGAFTPAGRVAKTGGFAARAGKTAAASAATQAGIDVAGQAAGTTDTVSPLNIDKSDTALAAAGGVLGEGIGAVARRFIPRGGQDPVITDQIRGEFLRAAQKEGLDPKEVTDDLILSWLNAAKKAGKPTEGDFSQVAAQQAEEFGIKFSKGQALPSSEKATAQLSQEDMLRYGGGGPSAKRKMAVFDEQQSRSIGSAAEGIKTRLGGRPIENPNEAIAGARATVQGKAAALDEQIGQAYSDVGDASLTVEGLGGMAKSMLERARSEQFVRNKDLAPATTEALGRINKVRKLVEKQGDKLKPMALNQLEIERRRLGSLIDTAANNQDRRQVTILKQQFDEYLDSAVKNALIQGDELAIESLKNARGLAARYRQQFTQQNTRMSKSGRKMNDTAGDYVERMVNDDPNLTDEQIANFLFGTTKLGARKGASALASKFKGILGAGSSEWNSIRQAGWLHLLRPDRDGRISGRLLLDRINEAEKGAGASLMRELYKPAEIAQMRRFALAVKRAQPEIENPSKTSYKMADIARQQFTNTLTALGFAKGGTLGAAAGQAAGAGSEGFFNLGNTVRAIRAARDPMRPVNRVAAFSSAGGPATVALGN